MRILVLGGLGKQGSVISESLIKQSPLNQVSIADNARDIKLMNGLHAFFPTNLGKYESILNVMGDDDFDLIVCAVPSVLGYNCVKAAVEKGISMVDLSFAEEDLSVFDEEAKQKGISIIVDAGVAPGLSHLIAGRASMAGPDSVDILVGGIAQDRYEPYGGYTITWSVEDLVEEYIRPARILVNGEEQVVDAMSGREIVDIVKDGELYRLESFYTDGLRSLLINNNGVPNMSEKTMRWPGHLDAIKDELAIDKDMLIAHIKQDCKVNSPDVLVMKISSTHGETTMVTLSDEKMSAMARTTAQACYTFASLITSKTLNKTGVLPPELLADDDDVYRFVLDQMADLGVVFSDKYPFM